jgi:hypothetical protein
VIERTAASSWRAAREHPGTYPGDHPASAFALVDDEVADLTPALALAGGASLADELVARGLPPVEDRIPVLAYGGNRNPATLALKLDHYGYRSPGRGTVLPVLTARLTGLEVVAGGLSAQGYLYATLFGDESTRDTELAVHVLLLDEDQARVMHESEGVADGHYDVGVLHGCAVEGSTAASAVLVYLGAAPVFVSPTLGHPLAFAAVRAHNRRLPAFGCLKMLAHALEALDLVEATAAVVAPGRGSADATEVAAALTCYLNGQWWWRRHTQTPRLPACDALEALIVERIATSCIAPGAALPGVKEVLTAERALDTAIAPRFGH